MQCSTQHYFRMPKTPNKPVQKQRSHNKKHTTRSPFRNRHYLSKTVVKVHAALRPVLSPGNPVREKVRVAHAWAVVLSPTKLRYQCGPNNLVVPVQTKNAMGQEFVGGVTEIKARRARRARDGAAGAAEC